MQPPTSRASRWPAVAGATLAGLAVALSAYAAHGVDGAAQAGLQTAAAYAFGHGVALVALASATRGRLATLASVLLLLGTLGFSGALASKHLLGVSTGTAPFGGSLLILGWLLHAVAAARR